MTQYIFSVDEFETEFEKDFRVREINRKFKTHSLRAKLEKSIGLSIGILIFFLIVGALTTFIDQWLSHIRSGTPISPGWPIAFSGICIVILAFWAVFLNSNKWMISIVLFGCGGMLLIVHLFGRI